MKRTYQGFAGKLYHEVPPWVDPGALFHVRLRSLAGTLTDPALASPLLDSIRFYEQRQRWHVLVWLLMPDHLHALLAFPPHESMSSVLGDWKRFQTKRHGIVWQEGYFDHRLRDDERGEQLAVQAQYISDNPVAKGLCANAKDWPWVYPLPQSSEGGS